jgi:cytochrome b561
LQDSDTAYGWISIGLHWITAVLIVYLLYLGSTIGGLEGEARTLAVERHVAVASASFVLLLGRVVWRFVRGHPGPTPEQRGWAFTLGKYTHYSMLVALALQLASGPLLQFSYGRSIEMFSWFVIPSPIEASFGLARVLHSVHSASALFIFLGLLLHIGGVYKHTAFNQDGTLAKMIIPGGQSKPAAGSSGPKHDEGDI